MPRYEFKHRKKPSHRDAEWRMVMARFFPEKRHGAPLVRQTLQEPVTDNIVEPVSRSFFCNFYLQRIGIKYVVTAGCRYIRYGMQFPFLRRAFSAPVQT